MANAVLALRLSLQRAGTGNLFVNVKQLQIKDFFQNNSVTEESKLVILISRLRGVNGSNN